MTTTPVLEDENTITAAFTLALMKDKHPELAKAERTARLVLAKRIQDMDAALLGGPALQEQTAVNDALTAYGNALADLLRGDEE
jgi:hypothetical protein